VRTGAQLLKDLPDLPTRDDAGLGTTACSVEGRGDQRVVGRLDGSPYRVKRGGMTQVRPARELRYACTPLTRCCEIGCSITE
jgi:hypothetical protein